jgi:hypothetical protein
MSDPGAAPAFLLLPAAFAFGEGSLAAMPIPRRDLRVVSSVDP